MRSRILAVLQALEKIYKGIITFSYKEGECWFIAIDDYDIYFSEKFKTLCANWRKVFNGKKIIFCYLKPSEKKLVELSEQGNLIMNV
jgi:hypothetical protein